MQLIVETEKVLGIEENMAAVENIQNNKEDNLDLNTTKCNGNKEIDTIAEQEEKSGDINEKQEVLANKTIENNGTELSNIELSEAISEKHSPRANNTQIDESQNVRSEERNGLDTNDIQTNSKAKNTTEEDCDLEDDIISINEEPYIRPEPVDVKEGIDKTPSNVESIENIEQKEETAFEEENKELKYDDDDDDIELIEESENIPVKSEKEQEAPEDKDDIEVIESGNVIKKEIDLPTQENKNYIEVVDERLNSPTQCDVETELAVREITKDITDIETTQDSQDEVQFIESPESKPTSITSDEENNDTVTTESSESENKTTKTEEIYLIEEDRTDEPKVNKKNDKTTDLEGDSSSKVKDHCEITIDEALPCENKTNSKEDDKDCIEIIDDTKPSENNADSPVKMEVAIDDDKLSEEKLPEVSECKTTGKVLKVEGVDSPIDLKDDIMDIDEILEPAKNEEKVKSTEPKDDKDVQETVEESTTSDVTQAKETTPKSESTPVAKVQNEPICKLSNTLDIFSDDDDDEEQAPKAASPVETPKVDSAAGVNNEKQCINIEDDDDIMVIDEDTTNKTESNAPGETNDKEAPEPKLEEQTDVETGEKTVQEPSVVQNNIQEETPPAVIPEVKDSNTDININEKEPETQIEKPAPPTQLIPENFVKTAKKKLADMTRDELEEFCILKIVESIVDRSSLGEIKSKIKHMTQGLDEYRKKVLMLTKQNRDLQVVLKSVQEEQKKISRDTPITPLKITRSVGMQIFMEKTAPKKKPQQQNMKGITTPAARNMNPQGPRPQKVNQPIPVPRLVPANTPALKPPCTPQVTPMNTKTPPNGMRNPSPNLKPEKRPYSKIGSPNNVTVDLTDDEPPSKLPGGPKTASPPVRLVPPQNLMAPRQPFGPGVNSPRKVYIPISGPQNQLIKPGQTIMLKTVPNAAGRPRSATPQVSRVEPNSVRVSRVPARHPAPLPLPMKQYQPPNWKSLPPAPDLKLSKVENGIVISWKIEGIPEESYEEIASYQLYAYQETSLPPSTSLWKKIGDVKALPLPMACTLTQFMAGFKYYFAIRAVDIKSRIGPFSLPGSILLLSKNI